MIPIGTRVKYSEKALVRKQTLLRLGTVTHSYISRTNPPTEMARVHWDGNKGPHDPVCQNFLEVVNESKEGQ